MAMKLSILICALASSVCAFVPTKPTKISYFSQLRESSDENREKNTSAATEVEAESKPAVAATSGVKPTTVLDSAAAVVTLFTKADLQLLAEKANPTVKYYDPLKLADGNFWGEGNEATIGWLRHAEIKHGRVAMAAFVGYWVQSNYVFPWKQTLAGDLHPSVDLSPEAQWDATPLNAKLQIILVLGALEVWDECGGGIMPHYMKGRRPGKYPSFQLFRDTIHFVFDLYDPFNIWKGKMSKEKSERRLVMEINNGRLAMLGIFGFLAADAVPGSVPALVGVAQPYEGNIMAPFESSFSFLIDK
eukprot:CAMPEP_0194173754 /NCGR_PEP_ID=MMETSP0154-20130528/8028_1 /TAXON_ID=1049557 /ORGANISM="Thalassiothrix antarctica, Strain L6-D1" /LENGTH=302 /DNA_ID=CAMNT_0038886923 /DNA_START=57 /DNA_END=965 /DNA_ORIENTATION=-